MAIRNIRLPYMAGTAVTKAYVDSESTGLNFRNVDQDCLSGIGLNNGDAFILEKYIIVRLNGSWYQIINGVTDEKPAHSSYEELTEEDKIGCINSSKLISCHSGYKFLNEYVLKHDNKFYEKYKLLFNSTGEKYGKRNK